MKEINLEFQLIPLEELRLELEYDDSIPQQLRYTSSDYTLLARDLFTTDAVLMLTQLYPVCALYRQRKKNPYLVIGGKRIFELAAKTLPPTSRILVAVLNAKISATQLNMIRYADVCIQPVLSRIKGASDEQFQRIDTPYMKQLFWQQPYSSQKSALAKALGVTKSALYPPATKTKNKGHEIP